MRLLFSKESGDSIINDGTDNLIMVDIIVDQKIYIHIYIIYNGENVYVNYFVLL